MPAGGEEEADENVGTENENAFFSKITAAGETEVTALTATALLAAGGAFAGACGAAEAAAGGAAAADDGEEGALSSLSAAPAAEQTWFAKSNVAFWSAALHAVWIRALMPSMKPVLPQMQV